MIIVINLAINVMGYFRMPEFVYRYPARRLLFFELIRGNTKALAKCNGEMSGGITDLVSYG